MRLVSLVSLSVLFACANPATKDPPAEDTDASSTDDGSGDDGSGDDGGSDDGSGDDGSGDDGGADSDVDTGVVDDDGDGYAEVDGDCDDDNKAVSPDADEICDEIDNDCDDVTDEAGALDAQTWYPDEDGDDYGDEEAEGVVACDPPDDDYTIDNTDCNDGSGDYYPGANAEICDDEDRNCDGSPDGADGDGDGFKGCEDDCDDTDYDINPDAQEVCDDDDVDEDCDEAIDDSDTSVDEGSKSAWYYDGDGDSYGSEDDYLLRCDPTGSYTSDNDADCDDSRGDVSPAGTEVCDDIDADEDCDDRSDDADPEGPDAGSLNTFYTDDDGDGYGDPDSPVYLCDLDEGVVDNTGDCDDTEELAWTDASEVCGDGIDNDCSGDPEEGLCGEYALADIAETIITTTESNADMYEVAVGQIDGLSGDDLVVGAGGAGSGTDRGQVYVFYDPTGSTSPSDADWTFSETADDNRAGYRVAVADFDGDSDGDILISAPWDDSDRDGMLYLFYSPVAGTAGPGDADVTWYGDAGDYLANGALANGRDLDSDGSEDFLIGYPYHDSLSGAVAVLLSSVSSASTGSSYNIDAGGTGALIFTGSGSEQLGQLVQGVGDVDGDGSDDILIGSGSGSGAGQTYLINGPFTTSVTYAVSSVYDEKFEGELSGGQNFGSRPGVGGGDVDGDGRSDLLMSDQYADEGFSDEGKAYLVLGSASYNDGTSSSHNVGGEAHATFIGHSAGDQAGTTTAIVPDLDAYELDDDGAEGGYADVVISSYWGEGDESGGGAVYIFYGPIDEASYDVEDADVIITGLDDGDALGHKLAVGDFDGDDLRDLALGGRDEVSAGVIGGSVSIVLGGVY